MSRQEVEGMDHVVTRAETKVLRCVVGWLGLWIGRSWGTGEGVARLGVNLEASAGVTNS